jgi:uncharacterized protein YhbP (UPF0306 family)
MEHDIKALVRGVLEKGHLLSLATVDKSGPWVSDLVYVFDDDLNIYWLSMPEARHSQAILTNSAVAGTITISTRSKEPNEAIQVEGSAEMIEGDILEMATKHLAKRGHPPPLREGEILEAKGQAWYKLTPKKFCLNYEPLFGRVHPDYIP